MNTETAVGAELPSLNEHNSGQMTKQTDQPTPSTVAGEENRLENDFFKAESDGCKDQAEWPSSRLDLRRELREQNLFVFHLPSDWREAELHRAFSPFGVILSSKVVKRPDGTSKGYGFVCFERRADAVAAVEGMNSYSVGGKRLKVSLKKTPEECLTLQVQKLIRMSEDNETFDRERDCSLFVFHLPPHWEDSHLRERFEPIVSVVTAKVSRKEDGTSRGYGFVTCEDPRAAALAILNLNGLEVCGKRLKVQPKQLGASVRPKPESTVFVFHLPNDWTDLILRQFFGNIGRVVSAKVQRDGHGRSRGFGFVTYDKVEAAQDAVNELNGVSVAGNKRLKVSLKRCGDSPMISGSPSRQNFRTETSETLYEQQMRNRQVGGWNSAALLQAGGDSQRAMYHPNSTPRQIMTNQAQYAAMQASMRESMDARAAQYGAAEAGRAASQQLLMQQIQQHLSSQNQMLQYTYPRETLWSAGMPYATTHPSLAAASTPPANYHPYTYARQPAPLRH